MAGLPKMTKREKLAILADLEDGYRPFDKHALTLLRSLLDDADAEVRAEAIACLWDDPAPRWIDVLMHKATEDPHAGVRAHAISALGRYVYEGEAAELEGWDAPDVDITPQDYARVTVFLLRIAQDPEEGISARRYAIEALAFRTEDPNVLDLIEWAYHHRDRRLKTSALFAMARNGNPRWTEYVLAELRSLDPQVQYEAVRAAGELGLHEATETLSELARGKGVRKSLRLLAIYALAETGDERALPVLERLTRSRDRDVRDVARDALEEWYAMTEMEQMADEAFDEMNADAAAESFQTDAFPDLWNEEMGTFSKN
jgi:HEAT repeat protein